ncbi:hypothetical protein [Spirosoma endbachense]|uniref:hypothetical protein n=1 Tax=Spirosoma endbachense TaxID=2666025 RepID=UPI0018E091AD|nr:hypothetical protein [Spirosoma endbachense]
MPQAFRPYHPLQIYTFLSLRSPIWSVSAYGQSQSKAPSINTPELIEITISGIHKAFHAGSLASEQLVNAYPERIQTYDQPTRLNSISVVNPVAIYTARPLDAEVRKTQEYIGQSSDYSDIVRDGLA